MRTFLLLALCLTAAAACRSTAPAPDFIAIENEWIAALQSHDTVTLDRLLDPTFIDSTFRGGIRTKQDVLGGPPAGAGYRHVRFDDLTVRRYGDDTAIASGVNVLQGSSANEVVRVRFTDVFVRRAGTWRAVSAQETLESH